MNWKMVKKPETEIGDRFLLPVLDFLSNNDRFTLDFFLFVFCLCFYRLLLLFTFIYTTQPASLVHVKY